MHEVIRHYENRAVHLREVAWAYLWAWREAVRDGRSDVDKYESWFHTAAQEAKEAWIAEYGPKPEGASED